MARLDFPSSPTPSQKHPSPAVAGQPVYTWDGEKWTSIASQYVPGTAPFEAMAYSGMQINGGMEVSQELGASGRSGAGFFRDGWYNNYAGTMVLGAGLGGALFSGFPASGYINVATAQTSLGAGDVAMLSQSIEGYRIARLAWGTANAQPITVAFWTKHKRAGLYSVSIRNGTYNRSYVTTYTQAVADVVQYNVITIPGDTAGTWAVDNTIGISLAFTIACGATSTTASVNTWLAGSYVAASGQVNAVASTADASFWSGVTVLPGTQAPTAAQSSNIMRSYDQELATCKRYWERVRVSARFNATGGTQALNVPIYWVEKRSTPTTAVSASTNSNLAATPVVTSQTPTGARFEITSSAPGDAYSIDAAVTADARL